MAELFGCDVTNIFKYKYDKLQTIKTPKKEGMPRIEKQKCATQF